LIQESVSFPNINSERVNLRVRKAKSEDGLHRKFNEDEKLQAVLKIFQGCWITSLTGINFKKNARRSSKTGRIDDLEKSCRFDVSDVQEIDFKTQTVSKSFRSEMIVSNFGSKKKNKINKTKKSVKIVQPVKMLQSADPNKYHPKDFIKSEKVESASSEISSENEILEQPQIREKPKQAKVYSSYKRKSVSDFEYRDYSYGDFHKDQKALSKTYNKKLISLNLPVFVEDGSTDPVISKSFIYKK